MLKMIAEDWRDDDAQNRAITSMGALSGQMLCDTGVTSDYAALSVRLIREFDLHDKDPATTYRILTRWKEDITKLIIEGAVAMDPQPRRGSSSRSRCRKDSHTNRIRTNRLHRRG